MNKVFISGSISIKKLPASVKESISKIVSQNMQIFLGDADGIDSIVQNYCKSLGYSNVIVYSIYSIPRYIVPGFSHKYIIPNTTSKNERERQSEKDAAMTYDSDFSLIIWNGKSKGSYNNIIRALNENKKAKVYLDEKGEFLGQEKMNKLEIEYIYRENCGYSASEVVEHLIQKGEAFLSQTRAFNSFLIKNKIIRKENGIYKSLPNYEHLFKIEKYRGKEKGIKFTNQFINWIENKIKEIKQPEQTSLF